MHAKPKEHIIYMKEKRKQKQQEEEEEQKHQHRTPNFISSKPKQQSHNLETTRKM